MVVANLAHLYKLNPSAKMVDDLLVALGRPPLNREVMLATGRHQPVRHILPYQLTEGRGSQAFFGGEMNVAAKLSGLELQPKPLVEKIHEGVQVMARYLAAAVHQRCVTPHRLDGRIERIE